MNMKNSAKVLLVLVAALLVGTSASAFVLLNPARTWDSAPTYIVDNRGLASITDNDGGVAATVNAITSNQAWNGSGAGNVINATAGSVASFSLGDGTPMLNFDDPINVCTGNCLAATFTGFFSTRPDGTTRIDDADIVTNTSFAWTSESEDPNGAGCASEFYIEGVQVHEIGHGLGLGHTDVGGATMFPSVSSCNNGPATTEADDDAGILALYAGGPPPPTCGERNADCSVDADCCSNNCRLRRRGGRCR
jgi:hypothetical protein